MCDDAVRSSDIMYFHAQAPVVTAFSQVNFPRDKLEFVLVGGMNFGSAGLGLSATFGSRVTAVGSGLTFLSDNAFSATHTGWLGRQLRIVTHRQLCGAGKFSIRRPMH